jgi:hypothetical protein
MSQDPSAAVEARVGHPGDKWEALKERVQSEALQQFTEVQNDWLDLMWTLDAYRIAGIPPRGMGSAASMSAARRLDAVYRGKGNWFAEILALLLHNRTSMRISPRQRVQGFSQLHQIDLAWPARREDVRVCAETKVTGAPSFGSTPARASMSDFSNRRKELKFAATDLKLYRRQQQTAIDHWGVWREGAPPKTYFLWAARFDPVRDRFDRMVSEARALVDTYLDGAGLFVWRENEGGSAYEPMPLPQAAHVSNLDDVLHRIASEISLLAGPERQPPPAVTPDEPVVDTDELAPDDG